MKYIDATILRNWANRRDCQDQLPLLTRKLIRATSNSIKAISFPAGENVLIGGWDGKLEVYEETEYLPLGTSLWEFGTNSDIKGKADADYDKRKANALGFKQSESTYIFVTPRLWTKKDSWIKEKLAEGVWKDVRVYDAETLEEWIEIAPSVGAWLAVNHLNILPKGIQAADDFWDEWATGKNIRFTPSVVLAGREISAKQLLAQSKQAGIIPIKGSSREEATAFIVAAHKNDSLVSEDFFARALIVDTPDAFREVILVDKPLFIIVRFNDDSIINRAQKKGHVVYVPLGIDNSGDWSDKIELLPLERDAFVTALTESGLERTKAEQASKGSARNLAVLRRQLEFNRLIPEWAHSNNVRDLIPAIFAERWDENVEEDRAVIELLAAESYGTYITKLKRWLFTADAPIVQIGSKWRLTSPLDAWTNAGKYCTRADFDKFYEIFQKIFGSIDPKFQLEPEERHRASWYGLRRSNSSWLREGIAQTMILISVYGDKVALDLPAQPYDWVDQAIKKLLSNNSPELWKSLDHELPLLAEASPSSFINVLEEYTKLDSGPIHSLFEEEKGFLHSASYHTGLLWALENISWMPLYLTRASVVLARLSEIDPGGNLANRPINSLRAVFKSWFPQTLGSLEERLTALKLILKTHSEIGKTLIMSLLPEGSGTASPTHRMRWRLSDEVIKEGVTYEELFKTHSEALQMLLDFFDGTEESFNLLVEKSFDLNQRDRETVMGFLDNVIENVKHTTNNAWHTLRKRISRHRSYPNAKWALPEVVINSYEKLYEKLTPFDPIEKTSWVLKEQWPESMDGKMQSLSHEKRAEMIHQLKVDAVKDIYANHGLVKILDIAKDLSEAELQPLAFAVADTIEDQKDLDTIWQGLKNEGNLKSFAQHFIDRKKRLFGNDFVFKLYEELSGKGFSPKELSNIFMLTHANKELWDFIDSKGGPLVDEYWSTINTFYFYLPIDETIVGISKLLNYQRTTSALYLASHAAKELDASILTQVLEKFITSEPEKNIRLNGYEIEHTFEELRKKENLDNQEMIKLEWLYLPLINQGYSNANTPLLHQEMSENPSFFIQVLAQLYKSEAEEQQEVELSDEQIRQKAMMAQSAYKLLDTWHNIPGVDKDWVIDNDKLRGWIKEMRQLAEESGHLRSAEAQLGSVLARYKEDNTKMEAEKELNWPPDVICEIIEEIGSEALIDNFSSGTYNKRSFSSRGPFDGGAREWHISTYFKKLAEKKAAKFPQVTAVLQNLSKSFERQAKHEDERAARDRLEH